MDIILGIQLKQSQQLNLTPKIIEELKVLQMSNLELEQYIEDVILDNPLLETEENFEIIGGLIKGYDEKFGDDIDDIETQDRTDFLDYTKFEMSLKEYLYTQLKELRLEPQVRKAAAYIIENIDERGYFTLSIKKSSIKINMSVNEMKTALRCIQSMEPAGIGARNLRECLIIQLKCKGIYDDLIRNIVLDHLIEISERKYKHVAKTLGVSIEEVIEVHNIIKMLNPKPGAQFVFNKKVDYIKPELEVRNIDGRFIAMLIDDNNVSVRISHSYLNMLKSDTCSSETSRYIKSKLSKAIEIVRAIEKRRKTVLDIAQFIVDQQTDFFQKGYNSFKPLTMKHVADSAGIHESTVSRTVNGKYIQTPKGIFELRFFFSSAIHESISSNGVKDMIKRIIAEEDKIKPFSDEQIRKILGQRGVSIARRTITKYREELSILPAVKRKL